MMPAWVAVPAAMLLSWLLCRWLLSAGGRLMDQPNERSLHDRPVPRGGGLGILAGLAAALVFLSPLPDGLWWVVALTFAIGAVSFLGDLYHLTALARLLVQMLLAAWLVLQTGWPAQLPVPGEAWHWPALLGALFGWLLAAWMSNLYNFMDGKDGFAAGMTLIGFVTLAILGWQVGDGRFALLCLVVAAAGVFLRFNFPPAHLFMGDVGSAALGFLVAGLLLWADHRGLFPLWVGVLVFSPFVVDATVTLLRRLWNGERVWQAHRSHYYQRLVRLGWGHRRTVLWEYALMLLCGASAIGVMHAPVAMQWGILTVWTVIYGLIILGMERRECRSGQPKG